MRRRRRGPWNGRRRGPWNGRRRWRWRGSSSWRRHRRAPCRERRRLCAVPPGASGRAVIRAARAGAGPTAAEDARACDAGGAPACAVLLSDLAAWLVRHGCGGGWRSRGGRLTGLRQALGHDWSRLGGRQSRLARTEPRPCRDDDTKRDDGAHAAHVGPAHPGVQRRQIVGVHAVCRRDGRSFRPPTRSTTPAHNARRPRSQVLTGSGSEMLDRPRRLRRIGVFRVCRCERDQPGTPLSRPRNCR